MGPTATAPARSMRHYLRASTLQPTVAVVGNLRLTRTGSWWADYLVDGMDYGLRDVDDKDQVRQLHQQFFQEVPDYTLLAGISAPMDFSEAMRRMVTENDLALEDYIAECNAQAARLEMLAPRTRLYWLSMPLDQNFRHGQAGTRLLNKSMLTGSDDEPSAEDMDKAITKAAELSARLAEIVSLTPVTDQQMRWLWDHHISRGLDAGPCPPVRHSRIRAGIRTFTEALFDEGANADRMTNATSWWQRNTPSFGRISKISRPDAEDPRTTYQCMLTVKSFPSDEMIFPGGSEFFQLADSLTGRGDDAVIDWALRIRRVPRNEVLARNVKTLRQIDEQMDQRDGETSFGTSMLTEKAFALADYNRLIEGADDEVEIRFTPIFAVGATDRTKAQAAVNELTRACKSKRITLEAPLGAQRELWMSMVPGAHHTKAVDACVHITTSADVAAFVPCVSARVGDAQGPIVGINLTSGCFEPVHLDITGKTARQEAASVATVGQPGGGKTYFLQTILGQIIDKGGQVLAVDRTELGEYAEWARGLTNPTVIDLAEPKYSMDPLRVFSRDEAAGRTLDLLLPLINVSATSSAAGVLQRMLQPDTRDDNDVHGLAGLVSFLTSSEVPQEFQTSEVIELANLLRFWRNDPNAAALFDPTLPPLRLDSSATIIRTHRLQLPTDADINSEHLFSQLSPTKHMGRALYGLTATIARRAFFAVENRHRLGVYALDEAHHLTTTHGGPQVITEFARDGRKNNAAIVMGSQDPDDYAELTDFFTTLVVFKQTKENQARKSLKWLGLDPDANPGLVKDLRYHTSPAGKDGQRPPEHRRGECYIRDVALNVARMKTLGPALQRRSERMNTNAPTARRR
ncbi:ATP-binding protein [Mycobacterium kansasii]|uniref:ATP-binding protein n=1 Tax=Mycobacterium kansasii TaxID=1768 RepID=UPI001CE3AA04|nr:ATP-binding protein [Mycobacterium kansasii]UCA22884.1 ATP-binding protein [Mycobacterium kansasii]